MASRPADIEQIAIRALLRHYWRKGLDAPGAVNEICAVEGDGAVDTETAHFWFDRFQNGQSSLEFSEETRKIVRWLPSETWDEAFQFVPFHSFDKNISTVCQRFWALAEPIINVLCPRIAAPIKICWESEELLRRFERGVELSINEASNSEFESLESLENGNLLKWEWTPIPATDQMPPNILGFQRIIVQGQIDRELLFVLGQFSRKIEECKLEINDLDNFVGALANEWIPLNDFLATFQRCTNMVLYRHIPAEFLTCHHVLQCPNLEIHWLEFEAQDVLGWLKSPMPNVNGPTPTKSLTIYGYYCGAAEAESVNLLLGTLISEHREGNGLAEMSFVVELRDFEELYLAEFEDPNGLGLSRLSETNWRLTKTANIDAEEEDQNQQTENNIPAKRQTLIEIGRFFS